MPWFMLSPSPVSILQYAVFSWIMSRYFLKKVKYRRAPWLFSFLDGFFIVALFVVFTDAFWCLFTWMKWLPLHPDDLIQISSSFGRDLVAVLLFVLLSADYFRSGVLQFSRSVRLLLLFCFVAQAAWFILSPSPVFTDYTYAWRHGADFSVILGSWILSHWVLRIPLWLAILKTRSAD